MNEPWNKKKKWNDFFIDFDFSEIERSIDELMNKIFSEAEPSEMKKPVIMGFSMRINSDGRPMIESFGNVKKQQGKPFVSQVIEPLVDIIEGDKEITITAELPGVKKEEINLKVENNRTILLNVKNAQRPYFKRIELHSKINKDSAKASFKNGILEVTFNKIKDNRERGNIKIE